MITSIGISPEAKMERVLYVVLNLYTEISIDNPLTGQRESHKVNRIEGYLPVFNSVEEAGKISENGRYKIFMIKETIKEIIKDEKT